MSNHTSQVTGKADSYQLIRSKQKLNVIEDRRLQVFWKMYSIYMYLHLLALNVRKFYAARHEIDSIFDWRSLGMVDE